MNHNFPNMFSPINIGTVTVPNRFVVPPMGNNFANTDGSMSERSAAYYEARAKGGFGLITIESTVVYKEAKGGPRKPAAPPERFAGEEFLILTKWNDLHRRAIAICRRAGFAPKVSMYLEQMMTAYYLACEGKGIAFVRDALLDCLPPTDKVFFYRIDSPESERGIYLSYKKSGGLTQIQRDFIEFMKRAKLPHTSAKTAEE